MPGMTAYNPARYSTSVSSNATKIEGASPSANFLPGPESKSAFTARALWAAMRAPIETATTASDTHTASQRSRPGCRAAIQAAARALTPIRMPPTPGTAVNEPARSMVSRMKRRLSMACACNATGSWDLALAETGPISSIISAAGSDYKVLCSVKPQPGAGITPYQLFLWPRSPFPAVDAINAEAVLCQVTPTCSKPTNWRLDESARSLGLCPKERRPAIRSSLHRYSEPATPYLLSYRRVERQLV